jgi:hypothetical protein
MQNSSIANCEPKVVNFIDKPFSNRFSKYRCIVIETAKAVKKFELTSFVHFTSQI